MMGKNSECGVAKLCPVSFGIAFGVTEALMALIIAYVAWFFGYGVAMVEHFSAVYYGYAPSFVGGLFGALWGFIGGFIFGFVVAYIYDFCVCRGSRKSCGSSDKSAKIE